MLFYKNKIVRIWDKLFAYNRSSTAILLVFWKESIFEGDLRYRSVNKNAPCVISYYFISKHIQPLKRCTHSQREHLARKRRLFFRKKGGQIFPQSTKSLVILIYLNME